jgi:uncharacterized phage protein (TIGR02218 family)
MSYDSDEKSVSDSAPVELYEFVLPTQTIRLTSGPVAITFAAQVYTPAALARTSVPVATQTSSTEVNVDLALTSALTQAIITGIIPSKITVTIRRYQTLSAASIILWTGYVADVAINGDAASLRIASLYAELLDTQISTAVLQRTCNHVLYDARCTVARGAGQATTISSTTNGGRTLVVSTVGGAIDQFYQHGELLHPITGERRTVLAQVGTTVTIIAPFPSGITNAYTLFAGCNHGIEACKTKFANFQNFGGHPLISLVNIFKTRVN